ncbi:uncharacterized protein B0H64DRAFT_9317 [Chaetomium fimeti]|uniref:Uncharacterized protein n=1 Tax=Chaetomium fimeti TaxID=1854472 RepID=A0AAE0HPX5_9PEZI|nr:hypothetical protein B0H64DRAFT_9317 [Chaetomium fimeti]
MNTHSNWAAMDCLLGPVPGIAGLGASILRHRGLPRPNPNQSIACFMLTGMQCLNAAIGNVLVWKLVVTMMKNLTRDVEARWTESGLSLRRCHGGRIGGDLVRCPQPRSRRARKGRESRKKPKEKVS